MSQHSDRTRIPRRCLAVLLALVLSTVTPPAFAAQDLTVSASVENALSWYCAHQKDHIQPTADERFRFMEDLDAYYIDHRHPDPRASDKVVYLTFDAGYENGNVARVLDTLREADVTGAFFVLGHLAEVHPELLRRMVDEGHLVCNHTFTHRSLIGASREAVRAELERLEHACTDCAGVSVAKYFRPPEGTFDRAMLEAVSALGYKTVFWSFAYADWDNARQPAPEKAKQKILDHVHNGAVLLLHPTSATNAAVLGDVIRELKTQGYRFGTLDELTAPDAGGT